MYCSIKPLDIVNVRITHKTAHVPLLEAVSFKDKAGAYSEVCRLDGALESVLIQTCNRIELYLVSEHGDRTVKSAVEYLENRTLGHTEHACKAIEYATNHDALSHLLRVTSGLESMVIGEDQVINQVWSAYLEAQKAKAAGPVLDLVFNRAVSIGNRVRRETAINRGAVSVGSAAVELAERLLGRFNDKKILIMGAGETGTLVAKSMARRCLNPVFIANRTYERALRLAQELGGTAVTFDKLGEALYGADVVFCCTGAPHYLLTKDLVSSSTVAEKKTKDLVLIDLSNPRNVEEAIRELPHVKLYNIDDLTLITTQNRQKRERSVKQATKILDQELDLLEYAVKADSVREIVSCLLSQIEHCRQRELAEALCMMGKMDERQRKIVNDLTRILLKQTFLPVVENFRRAAANNEPKLVEAATKLFQTNNNLSFLQNSEVGKP